MRSFCALLLPVVLVAASADAFDVEQLDREMNQPGLLRIKWHPA